MDKDSQKTGPPAPDPSIMPTYSLATRAMHADDSLNSTSDVAPAMHLSTTFRYSHDPDKLIPIADDEILKEGSTIPQAHIYSRLSAPNTTRFETILSSLLHGHAITYSSGLSAFHALMVLLNPKCIAIGDGYHGVHGVLGIHKKLSGLKQADLHNPESWDAIGLGEGDVVHVETPLNPTGEAYNIQHYADLAHARGAYLTVDATFGPPGIQDPFAHGADFVMHAGTKYFGGHSDMLCGVLATRPDKDGWKQWVQLWQERLLLGSVMGSLEGWLGVRSIRTLELRVQRQSRSTTALVQWLSVSLVSTNGDASTVVTQAVVERLQHSSLQSGEWLIKQMPNGHGPVFALWMKSEKLARSLPSKLRLFHHATSLGGVESLIEWRRMSDDKVDPRVLRISIGVEDFEDLKADLLQAFEVLRAEQ
ncbi:hypothetical protein FH972_024347 [Carpinus fangiana]|uniref:Cystathionine gamma-synthase n=1 Tax=Carpinus fangiana TaxID=176857 RepID=A0A5N6KXT0_9ROSI|nr:hypothetical protein FH972_024347 [Carpinus fangiana]